MWGGFAVPCCPQKHSQRMPLNSLPKWDYKGIFVQNKHSEKYKKCSAWLFPPLNPGGHLQEPLWVLSETRQAVFHSLESAGAELFSLNPELREPGVAPTSCGVFSKWQEIIWDNLVVPCVRRCSATVDSAPALRISTFLCSSTSL